MQLDVRISLLGSKHRQKILKQKAGPPHGSSLHLAILKPHTKLAPHCWCVE